MRKVLNSASPEIVQFRNWLNATPNLTINSLQITESARYQLMLLDIDEISASDINLPSHHWPLFAEILSRSISLQILDISCNNIEIAFIESVVDNLSESKSLNYVDMRGNDISFILSDGAIRFDLIVGELPFDIENKLEYFNKNTYIALQSGTEDVGENREFVGGAEDDFCSSFDHLY